MSDRVQQDSTTRLFDAAMNWVSALSEEVSTRYLLNSPVTMVFIRFINHDSMLMSQAATPIFFAMMQCRQNINDN